MAARDWVIKKAASKIMGPDERLVASCMANLPGTLKREGYYAALQNVVGIRFVDVAGEGGLPPKMNIAVTDRRVLLFEQSMVGFAKDLVAEIPIGQIAGARVTETGRAQVTVKVHNFVITFANGADLELESADKGGVNNLVGAINGRVRH
ncbi:hypothetical protein NE236_27200 [Actinoallomurus purpureus]|uniref:hypothetical protein n=1 Tax=Actinoallomurus purpureus TaxID=478114 RepID=UPI002092DAC3|nr:hypothetical protein [Actinoallomurus purpureus]MCO6008666.1 hypothetical protein [Actinoallomurus purpureus]